MHNIIELENMLLERFNTVTDEQIRNGMTWYADAHRFCVKVAKYTRTPLYKVVGILSALSPRNKWHRNKIDAIELIKRGKKGKYATFHANRDKALKILNNTSNIEEVRKILNAKKTVSFFNNILYPSVSKTVTIDVWAYRTVKLEQKNKNYNITEQAYKNVSDKLGIKAHNLQAILWENIRSA